MASVLGFFKDSSGKTRPITSRSSYRKGRLPKPSKASKLKLSGGGNRHFTSQGIPILESNEKPVKLHNPPQPPFNYAGGKYKMRAKIIDKMPPHKTYVEPFAGAGNIIQAKPPSEREVLNDKKSEIMNVHRTIKSRKQEWNLSPSRARWDSIKRKAPSSRSAEDEAYFIDHSYGGKGQNYTEKGKGGEFETDKLHDRYADVTMRNDDFAIVMKQWDSEQTLHYLDPPYSNDSLPTYSTKDASPERVAEVAGKMKGDVMISYDNSPRVRKAFSANKWRKSTISVPRGISGQNVMSKELLITNYNPAKERKGLEPLEARIPEVNQ